MFLKPVLRLCFGNERKVCCSTDKGSGGNTKAVRVHCYAHTLQLAVQDAIKTAELPREAIGLVSEVTELIKNSPKTEAKLRLLQSVGVGEFSVETSTLCPTRYYMLKYCNCLPSDQAKL